MDYIRSVRQNYFNNYKWLVKTFKDHGFVMKLSADGDNHLHATFTDVHLNSLASTVFWYPNGSWNTKKGCLWFDRKRADKIIKTFKHMLKTKKTRQKTYGKVVKDYKTQLSQSHKQEATYETTIKHLKAQLHAKRNPSRQKYLVIYNVSLVNLKPNTAHIAYTVLCSNTKSPDHYTYGFHLDDLLNNCHNRDAFYKDNIWLTESQILQLDFQYKNKEVIPVDDHFAKNIKNYTKKTLANLINYSLKK